MKTVGIGLLGFGTVGAGVVMGLHKNQGLLENRTGLKLELRRIADIDVESDRGVSVPSGRVRRLRFWSVRKNPGAIAFTRMPACDR